jgi:hypothetical protein
MVDPPPPPDAFRDVLRDLLARWSTDTAVGVEVKREQVGVLTLVYPWVAHTHRLGEAFMLLEEGGYSHEGQALVRSALEHSLLAHWVAVTGDAGVATRYAEDDRLLKAMVREGKGSGRDVQQTRWDVDLLQQLIDSREPVGADEKKVAHKIEEVCAALGLTNTVYTAYRMLSWFAHPTTHSVGLYLQALADGGTFALRERPSNPAPGGALAMMTHCVYWARRELDDMTVGTPHEQWLDGLASSIQVIPRLPGLSV